jgi:hypothetical protein
MEEPVRAGSIDSGAWWTTDGVGRCWLPGAAGLATFVTAAIAAQAHKTTAATSSLSRRQRGAASWTATDEGRLASRRAFSAQLTSIAPGSVSSFEPTASTRLFASCVGVSGAVIVIGNLPRSMSSFLSEHCHQSELLALSIVEC